MLSLLPLGVGRGADGVLYGHCSTSFVLLRDERPALLIDVGFGVAKTFLERYELLGCPIYVSHNHSDHAAELPVIGAVARAGGTRLRLLSEAGVMDRLQQHRLHELHSTGRELTSFFEFDALTAGEVCSVDDQIGIEPVRGRHAERSFGVKVSFSGQAVLSISADSGFDDALYNDLAEAPLLVLDGREKGNAEHASFDEIEEWAKAHPKTAVFVAGYGTTEYVPKHFALCEAGCTIGPAVCRP